MVDSISCADDEREVVLDPRGLIKKDTLTFVAKFF